MISTSRSTLAWAATAAAAGAMGLLSGLLDLVAPAIEVVIGAFAGTAVFAFVARARRDDAVVVPAGDGWAYFQDELARARRYERVLVVVRLPGDSPADGPTADDRIGRLARRLRSIDHVWVHESDTFLLLPETDRAAAESLVARLGEVEPWIVASEARVALFPDDGLTSEALVAALFDAPPLAIAIPRFRSRTTPTDVVVTEVPRVAESSGG